VGIFKREPSQADINAFNRGRRSSAKVARAAAQQKRDRAATRRAGNLEAQAKAYAKAQAKAKAKADAKAKGNR